MSAFPTPAPVISPWQANWTRYSTQIYAMNRDLTQDNCFALTVPTNQWWRVLFHYLTWASNTTVATRVAILELTRPDGATAHFAAPGTQLASQNIDYVWGVGLAAFATTVANGNGFQSSPIVDLVWPQGTLIQSFLRNVATQDPLLTNTSAWLSVEVYTEADDGTLAPAATPTPLVA